MDTLAKTKVLLGALVAALIDPASAQVGSIGVNFIGGNDNPPGNDASSIAPGMIAGVIPQANWNNVAAHSNNMSRGNGGEPDEVGSLAELFDSFGAATSATVSWNAENTFEAMNPSIGLGTATADELLLDGYLDSSVEQPNVLVEVIGIPYASYDVLVYFGSDGNGRTGRIRLNDNQDTDRFYETSTGGGSFQGAADYVPTVATASINAARSNFALYESVSGEALRIESIRGSSNSGLHGFQIVQRVAPAVLWVNALTGQAYIEGGDTISVEMNGYEVSSDGGLLQLNRFRSLESQTRANDDSEGGSWQTVIADERTVIEGFLVGSEALQVGSRVALGGLFAPGVESEPSATFRYSLATGQTVTGVVQVFDGPLEGDFNGDLVVDAADYTVWRDNLGAMDESALGGAGSGDGQVDEADYLLWRENYGLSLPVTAAVPEPISVGLAVAALSLLACRAHWR